MILYDMTKGSKFWSKVSQTFCFKSYLIQLTKFRIYFIKLLSWTVCHSQFENFFYKTKIDIIESFEDFSKQSMKVANIDSTFS